MFLAWLHSKLAPAPVLALTCQQFSVSVPWLWPPYPSSWYLFGVFFRPCGYWIVFIPWQQCKLGPGSARERALHSGLAFIRYKS